MYFTIHFWMSYFLAMVMSIHSSGRDDIFINDGDNISDDVVESGLPFYVKAITFAVVGALGFAFFHTV